ncbi:DUF3991 domain-containing protein [Paenibacillus sp. 1P07SE]|uniref:DUF3991 domain-containing protein n=1 Tax=Paenibacillus sp. 1P07SE TaxID=3132209 RepID=UPI0039A64EC7
MKASYYLSKDKITIANNINLIDLAKYHGYILENGGRRALHAKQSGGLYFFRDSNKYYHFSTDTYGGPIDFVIRFMQLNFKEAVSYLLDADLPQHQSSLAHSQPSGKLTLPDRASNYKRVVWYLHRIRGIEPDIIFSLIREKKLYQQDKTYNCVFVGYDQAGTAKYCSLRGSNPKYPFKQDRTFSDKSYPFHITGSSQSAYVFESPTDAMSHASLTKLSNQDWKQDHRISLGCLSDKALERFLTYQNIKQIIFCLDNDHNATFQNGSPAPNWGQEAAFKFVQKYAELGYATSIQTPTQKDFNEDLLSFRQSKHKHQTKQFITEEDYDYEP